jgi:hypothetical protein
MNYLSLSICLTSQCFKKFPLFRVKFDSFVSTSGHYDPISELNHSPHSHFMLSDGQFALLTFKAPQFGRHIPRGTQQGVHLGSGTQTANCK